MCLLTSNFVCCTCVLWNYDTYWRREITASWTSSIPRYMLCCRVVLGVFPQALVLPTALRGPDPVQRSRGLVRVHFLQHQTRPVAVRSLHPTGRKRLQLLVHWGETAIVKYNLKKKGIKSRHFVFYALLIPIIIISLFNLFVCYYFSPPDGVLHHHLLPVHLRLLHSVPHSSV